MNLGSSHPGLQLKNRKILLVADDGSKVTKLRDILTVAAYQVSVVNSGEAALDHYAKFAPDLILMDVELAWTNPFEVCRAIKERYGSSAAPVIFISSMNTPEAAVDGLAAGGVDYLSQPFREKEVLARLRVHLLNRLRLAQLNKQEMTKSRLLLMVAHDLRNPLVAIRALAHLMRNGTVGPVTARQRDFLDTIYDTSQSTLDLVNELFDVSAFEFGEWHLHTGPTVLAHLLEASVRMNNAIAAQKGSSIVLRPGPTPGQMNLDAARVRQILNNLLGNASKFSPPGSTITVDTQFNGVECAILIQDQGPGIKEGEHAVLFKDFGRTSVVPTGGETSTGLGLAICHKIMQAHGGSIEARNLPGGGAEFRVTFPINS